MIVSKPSINDFGIVTEVISLFFFAPNAFFSQMEEAKNKEAQLTKKLHSIKANAKNN